MKPRKHRAVFLDRDGVVNRAYVREGKPHPPATSDELEIPEGVHQALSALKRAGFLLIGVTNQPDVARGTQTREMVEAIHSAILNQLPLNEIRVCYHDDSERCNCRKPQPGLLFQAATTYEIELASSYMVGDRWKDIEAGSRAGCRTILIECGYTEEWLGRLPDKRVRSLHEASEWILSRDSGETEIR